MSNQFGLAPEEIETMILFRMGNAWLYQLAKAFENRNVRRADKFRQQLEGLLSGSYFTRLPTGAGINEQ